MADIVSTDDVMGGQPRIDGRRVSVLQIADRVREAGMQPAAVAAEFDLDLADVYRALAYYHDNIGEMNEWRMRRTHRRREDQNSAGGGDRRP